MRTVATSRDAAGLQRPPARGRRPAHRVRLTASAAGAPSVPAASRSSRSGARSVNIHRSAVGVCRVAWPPSRAFGGGVRGSTRPAADGRAQQRFAQSATPPRSRDVMSVLARAVREVEAAVERRRVTPAVRTKFQVVALLVREEHARVQGKQAGTEASRAEQLKRLDGIATILAKTAVRDPALLALLAEDAVVSDAARSLKREMLQRGRHRAGARGGRAGRAGDRAAGRRAPGRAAVGRRPGSWPTRSSPPTSRPPGRAAAAPAPAGRLGAARPAAQLVRAGRRAAPRRAWSCPTPAPAARARRAAS